MMTIRDHMPLAVRVSGTVIRGILIRYPRTRGTWFFCHNHPEILDGSRPGAMPPGYRRAWALGLRCASALSTDSLRALLRSSEHGAVQILNPLCPKEAL